MHARSTRSWIIFSALFVLAMGACGGGGGCAGCGAMEPLPGGALPATQTVEGGAQIRVTDQGFTKLTSILPGVLNQSFQNGFCIPRGNVGVVVGDINYCDRANTCAATAQNPTGIGCRVGVGFNTNGLRLQVNPDGRSLHARVDANGSVGVHITFDPIVGGNSSCTLTVGVQHLIADADIVFGIDPATGELTLHANEINQFSFSGSSFSGCGAISDILEFIGDVVEAVLNSAIGQFVVSLLQPVIDNLLQDLLPRPLGIEGMFDVGSLIASVSPGTNAFMETRLVPGGYVFLREDGLSLGAITGFNADEDPTTRSGPLASEPNLCVPPLPPPNLATNPKLTPTTRGTFALGVANEFNGSPDPNADLTVGLSGTTLKLAGHHAVTSGMMCLGVGTSLIEQLNVGTIGILVPSLGALGSDSGNDPLLLVTRPTRALEFKIGDNSPDSPALTIGVSHLEVDFYAFLFERYVRAFTLDLTMNIGVNLDFEQVAGQPATVRPTLSGISAESVQLVALNTEFVRETPEELQEKLPAVFDLVTPLLGDIAPIAVPSFAGFTLENLSVGHVRTQQDDFLALTAKLGASAQLAALAKVDPFAAQAITQFAPRPTPARSTGASKLRSVHTPVPDVVSKSLRKQPGGALPTVTFEVDRFDAAGRTLEWTYNLDNGMFRDWRAPAADGSLAVADRAFAFQGKYSIGLKSRVAGDYHTVSEVAYQKVRIDSVAPAIAVDKAEWGDDGDYHLGIWDIVSGRYVQYALGAPGALGPATTWRDGGFVTLTREEIDQYAVGGELAVYARDEEGNTTVALIAPFHGQPGEAGCDCSTGGAPSAGSIALFAIVGGVLAFGGRRRRIRILTAARAAAPTVALFLAMSVTMSLVPGCDCSSAAGKACETEADCGPDFCAQGEIAFCIDSECVCSDDIIVGRLGAYSDVAVSPTGEIWVSAYHAEYGDLVVAHVDPSVGRIPDESWEWVDGVPDSPVVVPSSKIRNGVAKKGDDVGMYTSIAVSPDGTPMVTYFDRETGSLKFAARVNGTWQIHVVDQGTGTLDDNGAQIGMYTAISLRSDDGRPGVAYLANVVDANGPRSEVRFAASQSAIPATAAEWMTWVVDSAPIATDADNIYPLPEGLGLFVDLARLPNQAPVVVYYDRNGGDLKVAKFDPNAGQFATPVVLDGGGTIDAGWSPSVAIAPDGRIHVAYVNASNDDLMYHTDAPAARPQIVDDGRRIVGVTVDNLPKPEYHFVGDDASLVLANGGSTPMIVYQDATTQELLLSTLQPDGTWQRVSMAGATDPWPGAYGFFAADTVTANEIIVSTWVVDQPAKDNWVEVFRRSTVVE